MSKIIERLNWKTASPFLTHIADGPKRITPFNVATGFSDERNNAG
jgi:hypothetical protein